ncbi:MAG: serine--tRNA ligase [Candidatus Jorgensenbacteria bacterium]
MLDINLIREQPDKVKEGVQKKNVDPKIVDKFLRLDEQWRAKTAILDQLKTEQNLLSKELSHGQSEEALSKAQVLKNRITGVAAERSEVEGKRDEVHHQLPNLPLADVQVGKDESGNKVLREVGEKPTFDFTPNDYLSLGEKLGIINVKKASEVSGPRFGYLMGDAVLLEFALVKLAFDTLIPEGFTPVIPPVLVKERTMRAMGYLDRHEDRDEAYFFEKDGLYLVGTSEQSLGPLHIGDVLEEAELPKRYVGFSSCFRREAGSYGKDTKGILRVHQFDKVEMFSFCSPEQSRAEHAFLLSMEEKLMQALEIPYRVVEICTGDLGNVAAAKFDIEAWFAGEGVYRETHSTSNCTDFQARRLNVKYRPKEKGAKPRYLHTLNGTAFSQRPLLAIIENNQLATGTIKVPKALQGYVGKREIGV